MTITTLETLRRAIFGLSLARIGQIWNKFPDNDPENEIQKYFQQVGCTVFNGCNIALELSNTDALTRLLLTIEKDLRGFAFEGSGTGLAILDSFSLQRKNRLQTFVRNDGAKYSALVYIGAGIAIAELKKDIQKYLSSIESLESWFAVDGFGFHYGMINWRKTIAQKIVPKQIKGYTLKAFDRGVGRSLWFSLNANIDLISANINDFPSSRQADIWSGIGFACTYAGGIDTEIIKLLKASAGVHSPSLGQGSVLAARYRVKGENSSSHTISSCHLLSGMSLENAARLSDETLVKLSANAQEPAYEIWYKRIQSELNQTAVVK